jgi:hypothetical protein
MVSDANRSDEHDTGEKVMLTLSAFNISSLWMMADKRCRKGCLGHRTLSDSTMCLCDACGVALKPLGGTHLRPSTLITDQ